MSIWDNYTALLNEIEKEKRMTKTERIEEMERQLSALKAEVGEEERVEYPCVKVADDGDCILFTKYKKGIRISKCSGEGSFGVSSNSFCEDDFGFKPFSGALYFKNGKPV